MILPKNKNIFYQFPCYLFIFMMSIILCICLFLSNHNTITSDFLGAPDQKNPLLLLTGIMLTICIIWISLKFQLFVNIQINQKFYICVFVISFILQILITYHYYFITYWDVQLIFDYSSSLAHYEDVSLYTTYFSRYPNNLMLASIFSMIISIVHKLGFHQQEYFSLIIVQCFLNTTTGILLISALKKIFENNLLCLIGYLFYIGLVGISPWIVIPYSDSMGLIFPVLIFNIYIYKNQKSNHYSDILKWGVITLLSYIGYKIKPQIIILFIGIIITELYTSLFNLKKTKRNSKKIFKTIAGMALGFILAISFTNIITNNTPLSLNSELTFGPQHFFMMGLNPDSHGLYNQEDVDYSSSFSSVSERNNGDLKVAFERIESMEASDLINHFIQKTLIIYNDGSFHWGGEGKFYDEVLPEKNHYISFFFRNLYYNRDIKGKFYPFWFTFAQMLWLTVLSFSILTGFDNTDKRKTVLMVSIIGLTLFELIFEARARYLFTYVPLYIILAVYGIKFLLDKFPFLHRNFDKVSC